MVNMTTNLSEMRQLVRRDLHDEDPADYRWTDLELERHIGRALREFSQAIPDEQRVTRATVAQSRTIDISDLTGLIMVQAVEYPLGEFPPSLPRFNLWAGQLTLLGREIPDGSDLEIFFGRLHVLDASTSTIPERFEDLVAGGAAGYAAVELASYSINRVNLGGLQTPAEFLAWGKELLERFRRDLHVLGMKNRVRVKEMYT